MVEVKIYSTWKENEKFNAMSPIMPSNFGGAPNAIGVSDEIVICQIYFKPGHCIDVC